MTYTIQVDGVVREATADEAARIDELQADGAAVAAAQQAANTARQSALAKLSALGLTDAEIAALVGA